MATKRHKPEEIVLKLRQVDVLVGQGMARVDAIRQVRITEQTYLYGLSVFAPGLQACVELKRCALSPPEQRRG